MNRGIYSYVPWPDFVRTSVGDSSSREGGSCSFPLSCQESGHTARWVVGRAIETGTLLGYVVADSLASLKTLDEGQEGPGRWPPCCFLPSHCPRGPGARGRRLGTGHQEPTGGRGAGLCRHMGVLGQSSAGPLLHTPLPPGLSFPTVPEVVMTKPQDCLDPGSWTLDPGASSPPATRF